MNRTAWGGHGRCLAAVAVWLLAACGGGGGDALSPGVGAGSTPSPAASNPSAASAAVTIFSSPSPQEYASVGVSTTDAGDGYEPVSQDARLRNVLFGAADQPRIRYAPGGSYELQLPGMGYDLLVHYKGLANPSSENNFFQPASAQQNYATFIISRSRLEIPP